MPIAGERGESMGADKQPTPWVPYAPVDPERVRLVVISECAASDPADDYGGSDDSLFDRTTLEAFSAAGLRVDSISDLRDRGVQLTVVLRYPKPEGRIASAQIAQAAISLADELSLYPNAQAYFLAGDVAISAINHISRTRRGKRAVPAGSTYRIRGGEYFLDGVRVFPSYLQAGPAWYIEASKREMIADDLALAMKVAGVST